MMMIGQPEPPRVSSYTLALWILLISLLLSSSAMLWVILMVSRELVGALTACAVGS